MAKCVLILVIAVFKSLDATNLSSCPRPANPVNGVAKFHLEHPEVPDGEGVTFLCNAGYLLKGNIRATCLNGKMSSQTPTCYPKYCSGLPKIMNGYWPRRRRSMKRGTRLRVVCNKGFHIEDPKSRTLLCQRRGTHLKWIGNKPACTKRVSCKDPGSSVNGERFGLRGKPFVQGKKVEYRCNQGFQLVGAPIITCQSNGTWDQPRPRCRPENFCQDLPLEPNGKWTSTKIGDYNVNGDKAVLSCNWGYEPERANDTLTCVYPGKTSSPGKPLDLTKLKWDQDFFFC